MNSPIQEVADHWNKFYKSNEVDRLSPPSQFAAFVIGEAPAQAVVIDMGCGSGRDSMFFASQGYPVIGIDAYVSAIEHCKEVAHKNDLNARFIQSEIQSSGWVDAVQSDSMYKAISDLVFYARFFLHAITEDAENELLDAVCRLAKPGGTLLAVEFRTQRDATLPKSTAQHFRRFPLPTDLFVKALARGMKINYFVEGFGYAKYGDDDAHVARCIFAL
jgi:SAM-dependent methyltransferase